MQINHSSRFIVAFVATVLLGFGQLFAQGPAIVVTETESYTQSTYVLTSGNKEAEVTVRKTEGKVAILLKNNKNGTVLGKATVKNDGSGNPNINIQTSKPETLPFWEFALDLIIPDGNGVSITPRRKAAKRCKEKCKDLIKSHAGFQVLVITNGSGNSKKVVPLGTVKKAFEAYHRCMWKCMREAKDRYQGN
ncbi:MAG: hypothetical protein AAF587_40110 [Bacteroidota bacterium]